MPSPRRHLGLPNILRALALALFSLSASALEIGSAAPAIALPDASGQILKLEPGKIRYVDFWAAWCAPCRHSFPWMNEMFEKYRAQGFEVLGVNLDTDQQDTTDFLARVPAKFPVVYDPEGLTPAVYGVKGMPTSVLIDRDGKVLFQHIGFTDGSREGLEAAIKQALSP